MAASTSFEIGIGVQATGLSGAASACDELAKKLTSAGDAATKAAELVSAGEAAYRRAEAAALGSAKAVEKNAIKLKDLQAAQEKAMNSGDEAKFWRTAAAIEALSQKQSAAVTHASAMAKAFDNEASKLDGLRQSAGGAAQNVAKLKAEQAKLAEAEKKSAAETKAAADASAKQAAAANLAATGTGKLNEAAEGFGKLGGPVGMLGQKVLGTAEGVGKMFSSMGAGKAIAAITAVGVVGLVVAIAALAVAAATALVKVAAWAIGLGDANRSAALLSAGIAGTVKGGAELESKLDSLQNKFPQSREELQGMAGDLAKTGLKGKALTDALEDAAEKAARVKFGPDFAKQVNALPNLSKRFQQNIAGIFGGLELDGLLKGLGDLVNMFDKNTATGKAIKVVFESLFQPAIDGVSGFIPKVISAFIQFEIWVLKAMIAIKPFGSTLQLIGVGIVAMGAMAIAPLVAIAAGLAAMAATAVVAVKGFKDLYDGGKAAYDKLKAMSFSEIGTMLIDGLVSGITGGVDKVVKAVSGVADSAIGAAKSVLGIASPSKVFAQIGGFTAEGMAGGVDEGSAEVKGALETMVSPPEVMGGGSAPVAAAPSGSAQGGKGFDFTGAQFTFNGVKDASDATTMFGEMLTRFIEGDAAQLGAEVPA